VHFATKDAKAEYLLGFLQRAECQPPNLFGDIINVWKVRWTPHCSSIRSDRYNPEHLWWYKIIKEWWVMDKIRKDLVQVRWLFIVVSLLGITVITSFLPFSN